MNIEALSVIANDTSSYIIIDECSENVRQFYWVFGYYVLHSNHGRAMSRLEKVAENEDILDVTNDGYQTAMEVLRSDEFMELMEHEEIDGKI